MELNTALALSFCILVISGTLYYCYNPSSLLGKICIRILELLAFPAIIIYALFYNLINPPAPAPTPTSFSNNTLAVLAFLQAQGLDKKFTTADIMKGLNMNANIVVGCLTSLVNKGFVERTPTYEDEKEIKYIQITVKGFNYDIFKRE